MILRTLLVLASTVILSGCYVTARTPGYCEERRVYDGYGGYYYETYCNRSGAYVPIGRVRYPVGYRRPARGGVIVTPPYAQPPRRGGVIVTPPARGHHPGRGGVIVTPPRDRHPGRGGVIVTPPSRGGRGRGPRPHGASITLPASALQRLVLMGPAFDGASVERRVDPSLEPGKIMIEAQVIGDSDEAVATYLERLEGLNALHLSFGNAVVGSAADTCTFTTDAEGHVTVEGVCVDSVRIITPADGAQGPAAEVNGRSV